jgi:hypothetical protein
MVEGGFRHGLKKWVGSPVATEEVVKVLRVGVKGLELFVAEQHNARACQVCSQTNLLKRRWSLAATGLSSARACAERSVEKLGCFLNAGAFIFFFPIVTVSGV